jgi:hypothetical protein
MAHLLSLKKKEHYLHVTVTGDNTPEDVREYLAEVVERCSELGYRMVLIEENLQGRRLGTMSVFTLVAERSARVGPLLRRVAYVDVNPASDMDSMRFAETVAVNRGVNLRVFATVPDAEKWLLEDAGHAPAGPTG